MPRVMKENKQLTISEDKAKEFLELGYSLIDDKGNIVQAGTATSLTEIKAENDTLKAELTKVKAENDALKAQLEVATKKSK